MGLDIRWPIGLMFTLIGALLVLYGLFTGSNTEMYQHSLGMNVNLSWGVLLLVFGVTMLGLAWRDSKKSPEPNAKENKSGAAEERK